MSLQAIILAAGEGTRMRPLTLTTPKPLVKVSGKPLIEHIVSSLPAEVDELIIVVGYLAEQVETYCGENFLGRKVSYVRQEKMLGTANALFLTKPFIKDKFFVLMGDDMLDSQSLADCLKYDLALVVSRSDTPEKFGVVETDNMGAVTKLVEKPDVPKSNLVSTGAMLLDTRIFNYSSEPGKKGEYYITDLVDKMIHDAKVHIVEAKQWIAIASPEDLEKAEQILSKTL